MGNNVAKLYEAQRQKGMQAKETLHGKSTVTLKTSVTQLKLAEMHQLVKKYKINRKTDFSDDSPFARHYL